MIGIYKRNIVTMRGLKGAGSTPATTQGSAKPQIVRRPSRKAVALPVRCQQQQPSDNNDAASASTSGRTAAGNPSGSSNSSTSRRLVQPVTLLGATTASGFVFFGPGDGGNGRRGGGGGDGSGGGGGGGDGSHQQPLYDVAEDAPEEEVPSEDTATPEPEQQQEDVWKELVTPSDEIDAPEGERQGTNRCVEVVVEGWPQVGSLPAEVCLYALVECAQLARVCA